MSQYSARIKPFLPVDFFGHQVPRPLQRIESLRDDLQPILKLLKSYMEILGQKGSVAKHLHMPLFSSRIEDRINGLFSSSRPQVVNLAIDNIHCGVHPSWVDLIQESISKDQFELCDEHRYRCFFRGIAMEMSKSDCDALSSDVLRKLLEAPPEPGDMQTEREARAQLIQDLTNLEEDISEMNGRVQTILKTMQEQDPHCERDSPRLQSSEPPMETNMGDVDTNTDLAIHTETRTAAEPSLEPSLDGETSNSIPRLSISGENSHTPPVRVVSGWSPSEKRQLRTFLKTRGHLSWSRIAQEYEEIFHKGRSISSIRGQARCLGLSVGRQSRKKPGRPKRRDPLVLRVRFPSDSTEQTTSTESAPTRARVGEDISLETSEHGYQMQEATRSPEEGLPVSSYVGPSLPPMGQFSPNENSAEFRQPNHQPPGSFGLILN
ncbi:uncharacterized protein N7473_007578 [Penicillium subrubescens]|uniref:uncharacterized protein n=1 Tax=Penicillium subrubescens TaxID=1316194 RepID=UPI002544FCB6|nr:uncharacterized protein N7473_007578 [Penicillium subrubescens]KAJ5891350.1 hypothetical protein N7473_007578 [Penicillium subrubescens]